MKKPPITADEKRPPYTPIMGRPDVLTPGERVTWDQNYRMWIMTAVRRRSYICSKGEEHRSYYRTHWQQGREDWVACEHEVVHERR